MKNLFYKIYGEIQWLRTMYGVCRRLKHKDNPPNSPVQAAKLAVAVRYRMFKAGQKAVQVSE